MKQIVCLFLLGTITLLMIQSESLAGKHGSVRLSKKAVEKEYYVILGAIGKPGVYEIKGKAPQISELIQRAGGMVSHSHTVHLVRNGRAGLMLNLSPQNNPLLLKGDIVYVPGASSKQSKVYITLVNLISRPVVLPINKEDAKIDQIMNWLGQPLESVHVVHAKNSMSSFNNSFLKLTTGTVLVFKPGLIATESIPPLTAYYPDRSIKAIPAQQAVNSLSPKLQAKQKKAPRIPVLPVPIKDPEVGIVNSEGKIELPPAHAEYLDVVDPLNEKDGLKASSKVSNRKELQLPALAVPSNRKAIRNKQLAEDTAVVPPPPVEKISQVGSTIPVTENQNKSKTAAFKVTSTMIISVMIAAIIITATLLGSMAANQGTQTTVQASTEELYTEKPVFEKPMKTIPQPKYIRRNREGFDLEALIQDELVIHEKEASFSNIQDIYGTPAGPRMIRVEQKQEIKAPHYVRETRKTQSGQKEAALAGMKKPSNAVQEKIQAQIAARLNSGTQQPTSEITDTNFEQHGHSNKKKSFKLKKPALELSIEQKLGMLDKVLSSVQKPKET